MKNCYFLGSKLKFVFMGRIVPIKRLWRSQTCQKVYWIPNSHNSFFQVALGRYKVTLKRMLDGTLLPRISLCSWALLFCFNNILL